MLVKTTIAIAARLLNYHQSISLGTSAASIGTQLSKEQQKHGNVFSRVSNATIDDRLTDLISSLCLAPLVLALARYSVHASVIPRLEVSA